MQNKYLAQFLDTCSNRYSVDRTDMTLGQWICENTTLRGKPFSFDRYPFQEEIANDMHQRVAVIKCSQIGLTEVQIRKALAVLHRNPFTTCLYSLPDKRLRDVNSRTRIKPILEKDKIFNPEGTRPARSVDYYEIGRSHLHVQNASESAATSISLDILMVDEVDLTPEQILGLYNSRLQNSDEAIRHDFSTPSFADYGIDVSFQNSDQREYLLKCDSCGHWQAPDWDRKFLMLPGLSDSTNLDEITAEIMADMDLPNCMVVCEKCHSPLDLQNSQREWVAKKPSMSMISHGYKVNPFSTGRLGVHYILTQLLDYQKRDYLRGFYNTVLGRTYSDANTRLTERHIKQNLRNPLVPELYESSSYYLGIDVGALCHLVLIRATSTAEVEIVWMDTVASPMLEDKVRELYTRYNIVGGGIDMYPYTPTARSVFSMTDFKVYPVEYSTSAAENYKLVENDMAPEEAFVKVNRTWALDKVAKNVREKTLPINGYEQHEKTLIKHLQNMVRDEQPEKAAIWRKLSNDDHFFHAIGYALASVYFIEYIHELGKDGENREVCATMIATIPASPVGVLPTVSRNNTKNRQVVTGTVLG